jgi:hypothetical protein
MNATAHWHTAGMRIPLDFTYALDQDGNNVEAVYHGPTKRSAASVEVEPA